MNDAQRSYIRISGGLILTCDGKNRRIDRGEIWVRGGKIVALGNDGAWTPPDADAPVDTIDAVGRIVMPGLTRPCEGRLPAERGGTGTRRRPI